MQVTSPRLILASTSPRRRTLLEEAGFRLDVEPADVDEDALSALHPPERLAESLAAAKAQAVAERHAAEAVVVLAADTIVVSAAGEVLGKASDRDDARRIILALSGTRHAVLTGWCAIRCRDGGRLAGVARTEVVMRKLSAAELEEYLASGQWEGKAGAYGIQDDPGKEIGEGDPFIQRVMGELTNVVGLPMPEVTRAINELGVRRASK